MRKCLTTGLIILGAFAVAAANAKGPAHIKPGATKVLSTMTETLRAGSFSFQTRDLIDVPTDDNRIVQLEGRYTVQVRRPDQVYTEGTVGGNSLALWYAAGELTLHNRKAGTVAKAAAPKDLDAFLDWMATQHDILLPGHDFLYSNVLETVRATSDAGRHVGVATVQGKSYDHLQFEDDDFLWELCVAKDSPQTPARLIMRDPKGSDVLYYEADYTNWRFEPIPADAFVPNIPNNANWVELEEIIAALKEVE